MKKVIYFLMLMSAMTILNIGCEKPDDGTSDQTLAQAYPNWINLTWVSTDGASLITTYPRLDISIVGDVATIHETTSVLGSPAYYTFQYDALNITSTTATFSKPHNGAMNQTMTIKTPPDNAHIKVSWEGHDYVLQIYIN